MLPCPECRTRLTKQQIEHGLLWHCENCRGRAVGVGLLRRLVAASYITSLWGQIVEHGVTGGRPCAFCQHPMTTSPSSTTLADQVDVCLRCQVAWFDAREFEHTPKLPEPPKPELSQEALEAIGRVQAATIAQNPRYIPETLSADETMMAATAVLGLPVEEEAGWLKRNPWLSWGSCVAVLGAGIAGLAKPELVEDFGLIAADPFRHGAATFITALFLHAGVLQLAAGIYFLALFGDNVEDFLGRGNYALLLLVAGLVGGVLHVLFTGDESTPAVGASPAVAGIVVFYALKFPRARVGYLPAQGEYSMPASAALALWLGGQVLVTRPEFLRTGTSSVWIYIGGAAVGLLFWRLFRDAPSR